MHAVARDDQGAVATRIDRVDRVVGRVGVGVERLAVGGDAPGVALQEGTG